MAELPASSLPPDTDPRRALRTLIERGEGASEAATMLRMVLLRQEHPATTVATEVVRADGDVVVVRATIGLPTGATGSGIAAEHIVDEREWAAAVERTETRAIARALDTLGVIVDAPAPSEAGQPPREPPAPAASTQPAPEPEPTAPTPHVARLRAADEETPPPVIDALRRANRRQATPATPTARPPASRPTPPEEDEAPLEDYSWTAFWTRARELGLDRAAVEQRLGRPIHGLSPRELREALEQTGLDFGPSPRA